MLKLKSIQRLYDKPYFSYICLRACDNADSITSNNTYLNTFQIFFFNFFQFKEHRNRKFTSHTDLRKQDFSHEEKLSDYSRFWKKVNKEDIFNKILVNCKYFEFIEYFDDLTLLCRSY